MGGETTTTNDNLAPAASRFAMADAASVVYKALLWKNTMPSRRDAVLDKFRRVGAAIKNELEWRHQALSFLTAAWLTDAISGGGAKESGRSPRVASFTIEPLQGCGFLSLTFRLLLTYEGSTPKSVLERPEVPASLILKVPGTFGCPEDFTALAAETHAYRQEAKFYVDIAPVIKSRGVAMRVPKLFRVDLSSGEDARILMEDVGGAGFSINQVAGLPVERVEALVVAAGALHAAFWEGHGAPIPSFVPAADASASMTGSMTDGFLESFGSFERSHGLRAMGLAIPEDAVDAAGRKLRMHARAITKHLAVVAPQTLCHGDYRADNCILLHPPSKDSVVLDWQLYFKGPGAYDVQNIVVASMAASDRKAHCERLLRLYHASLVRHGVTDYAWAALWRDFKFCLLQMAMLGFNFCSKGIDGTGLSLNAEFETCKECLHCQIERTMSAVIDYSALDLLP